MLHAPLFRYNRARPSFYPFALPLFPPFPTPVSPRGVVRVPTSEPPPTFSSHSCFLYQPILSNLSPREKRLSSILVIAIGRGRTANENQPLERKDKSLHALFPEFPAPIFIVFRTVESSRFFMISTFDAEGTCDYQMTRVYEWIFIHSWQISEWTIAKLKEKGRTGALCNVHCQWFSIKVPFFPLYYQKV